MSFSVASNILRGGWLIEKSVAQSYIPVVAGVLMGKMNFEPLSDDEKAALETYDVNAAMPSESLGGGQSAQTKNIKIIPVTGALMKYTEDCGPIGMMDLAKKIEECDNDRSIDAIILKIDSPGGMVNGAQTFADAILKCSKPVIAFIQDGMCASAAYWIASCCDEIISSHDTNTIGSIGVYCTLADFKTYYEKQGLPIHEIYATPSTEKNKGYLDAMNGDYASMKEHLDFIAAKFIDTVKANRAGKLNLKAGDPFKGDTYYANRAIEIGLIDKIGGFDDAINSALLLINEGDNEADETEVVDDDLLEANNKNNNNLNMKIKILSSQAALAALLAVSFAAGETEKEMELDATHLALIEGKLTADAGKIGTLEASVAEKNATIASQASKITALENESIPPAGDAAGENPEGPEAEKETEASFVSESDAELAQLKASMGPAIPTGTK